MSTVIGSIITDCADDNARSRQELRFKALFGAQPTFVGVHSEAPDLEAAGQLLDSLDVLSNLPASRPESDAIILVNVSPRGESKKHWDNGTPFCYFRIGKALVLSSFAGRCLSLVQSLGLVSEVALLDIPTVVSAAVEQGELTEAQAERITHTQFRSLEFLPLVAYWLYVGKHLPATIEALETAHDINGKAWFIDNFGNVKTTLLPQDVDFEQGKQAILSDEKVATHYRRLTDVPKQASALTIGSSGYGKDRLLEVAVQWRGNTHHQSSSATERHHLKVGSPILKST